MRNLWFASVILASLALAGCQSGPTKKSDSSGSSAATTGSTESSTPAASTSDPSPSGAGKSGTGTSKPDGSKPDSSKPDAPANPLAGKWELDIVTDNAPHLLLLVADDLSATLLSSAGFNGQQYGSIKFVETNAGIAVVIEEIQKCGNRTVTYTTTKSGDIYTGYVSGPNANCQSGTFRSPAGAVELEKQQSS